MFKLEFSCFTQSNALIKMFFGQWRFLANFHLEMSIILNSLFIRCFGSQLELRKLTKRGKRIITNFLHSQVKFCFARHTITMERGSTYNPFWQITFIHGKTTQGICPNISCCKIILSTIIIAKLFFATNKGKSWKNSFFKLFFEIRFSTPKKIKILFNVLQGYSSKDEFL